MSDFYEKQAARFEKMWLDEVAAGKVIRAQRDEVGRLLAAAESQLRLDGLILAAVKASGEHTGVPQTYYVLKRGTQYVDNGGDITDTASNALKFTTKPLPADGEKAVRVSVYEDEV